MRMKLVLLKTQTASFTSANKKTAGQANFCLSDYISPVGSDQCDFIGAFAVSAGFGVDELVKQFEQVHDDYHAILVKALADRLAEALAEYMHQLVRTEIWAYAPSEHFTNDELIKESYTGIRPAPGYPACPDHTENKHFGIYWKLNVLLDCN